MHLCTVHTCMSLSVQITIVDRIVFVLTEWFRLGRTVETRFRTLSSNPIRKTIFPSRYSLLSTQPISMWFITKFGEKNNRNHYIRTITKNFLFHILKLHYIQATENNMELQNWNKFSTYLQKPSVLGTSHGFHGFHELRFYLNSWNLHLRKISIPFF